MRQSPRSAAAAGRASTPRESSKLALRLESLESGLKERRVPKHGVDQRFFRCLCGQMVPAAEMDQHISDYMLIDFRLSLKAVLLGAEWDEKHPDEG